MKGGKILAMAVLFEGGLLLLAGWVGAALGVPAAPQIHLTGWGGLWGVAGTLPLLISLAWATRSTWAPLARLRTILDRVVEQLFARCSLMDLAIIASLAGLGEEALFRGVLQTALAGSLNVWLAVFLIGALFGLVHFISTTYAIYAGLVGVYLGALHVLTGNLLVPILTHAVYDFVALTYLVKFRSHPAPSSSGEQAPH